MGEAVAILLCLVPTLWEIYDDRHGETKKDKTRDAIVSVILYSVIALVNWKLFEIPVFKSLALSFAWRVLLFDYLIACVLIRKGVIRGHWFSYSGKTARWDKLIARVNPWVQLVVRAVVFVLSLLLWASANP